MKRGLLAGWWMAIALVACTHQRTISPDADRSLLFPLGVYTHQIEITLPDEKQYQFKGLVRIAADKVVVVGLSPFQTTLFRLEEDRKSGKVSTEVFQDGLKAHQDKLAEFYTLLRSFLTLPRQGNGPKIKVTRRDDQGPQEWEVTSAQGPVKIDSLSYDDNKIPIRFRILHPRFRVEVYVPQYKI